MWNTLSLRRSDFSRISIFRTGAQRRAGTVQAFDFPKPERVSPKQRQSLSQTEAQYSGFDLEMRSGEMSEHSAFARSERYGTCNDEGAYRFRRGHGSGNSGRWRLATLKLRSGEMSEHSAFARSERYGTCNDEGAYRFRRGHGSGNSGRWRLATLKRAFFIN